MGYVVAASLVLLGIYKKDAKLLTAVLSVYLWAMVALNVDSADYATYKWMYTYCFDPRLSSHEPGYMLLSQICLTLGLSYQQFRMVISVFVSYFSIRGLSFYTKNVNYAVALYLLFPFAAAASGLRNTLANAIVLYGIHFLFEKKPYSLLKYFLTIFAATLFHFNSLFYLILPIVLIPQISFFKLLVGTVAAIPCIVLVAQTGILYTIVSWFTTSEKVLNWFTFSIFLPKIYIFSFGLAVGVILLLYYSRKFLPSDSGTGLLSRDDVTVMSKIGVLTLLSFSGAIFRSVVFLRLLIGIVPLYYAVFAETLSPRKDDLPLIAKQKKILYYALPLFCGFLLWFVYGFWIGGEAIQNFQRNLLFS